MKRILLFLLLQVSFLVNFADEYTDPVSNVIYTYDPAENRAEVKQGVDWIDTDDGQNGIDQPGSPNAQEKILILDRFTIDGKDYIVDKIGDYAFFQMKNITSIVIPSSIRTIGCNAFQGCSALSNVVINNGLTSINELAFARCESLEGISLPETLKEIGPKAFHSCSSLKSLSIPSYVTSIGKMSFYSCYALSSISVEEGNPCFDSRDNCNAVIETANNRLILGCKATQIPNTVASIGYGAFAYCKDLQSIKVPESVKEIGEYAFNCCTGLKQVSLSEGLEAIESYAFFRTGLTDVIIPSSVQTIGEYVFSYPSLNTITSLIEKPFKIKYFFDQQNKVTLRVPAGTKSKYEATPGWNQFLIIEEIQPTGISLQTIFHNSSYYDLQGRKVNSQLSTITCQLKKGIYIQNGKKVAVK